MKTLYTLLSALFLTVSAISQPLANLSPQDFSPMKFPNVLTKLATNGTIMDLGLGDSVMNNSQLHLDIFNYFLNSYGFGGVVGQGGEGYLNPTVTSANAYLTNDLSVWFAQTSAMVGAGAISTVVTSQNWAVGITGNVWHVIYDKYTNGGHFRIDTNCNNLGWATAVADVDATSTALWPSNGVGAVYAVTNAWVCGLQVRAVWLSGTNKIIGGGVANYGANGGVIYNQLAVNGLSLQDFVNVGTNISGPVFLYWNPTFVVTKWLDSPTAIISALPAFNRFYTNFLQNADLVWCGAHPIQWPNDSVIGQNGAAFRNVVDMVALGWPWAYYDGYIIFGNMDRGVANGYLQRDDVHLLAKGNKLLADSLCRWLDFWHTSSRNPYNAPGADVWTANDAAFVPRGLLAFPGTNGGTGMVFTNGTKNLQLYLGGVSGVHQLILRDAGSGYGGDTWVWGGSGGTDGEVFGPVAGVARPFQLGTSAAPFDSTFSTNVSAGTVIATNVIVGPTGATVTNVIAASANLDFPSTAPTQTSDLRITLTGVGSNDVVTLGVPFVAEITNTYYTAFPSNGNVWVRFHNLDTNVSQNPGPAIFKVLVTKF